MNNYKIVPQKRTRTRMNDLASLWSDYIYMHISMSTYHTLQSCRSKPNSLHPVWQRNVTNRYRSLSALLHCAWSRRRTPRATQLWNLGELRRKIMKKANYYSVVLSWTYFWRLTPVTLFTCTSFPPTLHVKVIHLCYQSFGLRLLCATVQFANTV